MKTDQSSVFKVSILDSIRAAIAAVQNCVWDSLIRSSPASRSIIVWIKCGESSDEQSFARVQHGLTVDL